MSNQPILYRPREGIVLAGVCAGIGKRIGIDAGLLRIIMVVLTVLSAGWGIALYIIGVIAIPRQPTQGDSSSARKTSRMVGIAAIVAAIGVSFIIAKGMPGWLIVVFVVLLVSGLSKLRGKSERHSTISNPTEPTPYEREAQTWQDRLAQVRAAAVSSDTSSIYSEPTATTEVAVKEVEGRVMATWRGWLFALALAGIGVGTATALQMQGYFIPSQIWPAVILLALGITLIVSTWKGRPKLMVFTTIVVGIVTLGMAAPSSGLPLMNPVENIATDATSHFLYTDEVPDTLEQGIGTATYDFSELQSRDTSKTSTLSIAIDHGVGDVTLIVPKNAKYHISWSVGMGSFEGETYQESSEEEGNQPVYNINEGVGLEGIEDGGPENAKIEIEFNISVGIGKLSVIQP